MTKWAQECPADLPAHRTRHQPAPLPPRLDRIAAAHAVRPVVGGVKGISDAPRRRAGRLFARPPWVMPSFDDRLLSGRCDGRCRYQLPRPPLAPTLHSGMFLSSGRIGLRRRWLPGGHDVGDRLCCLGNHRLGWQRRRGSRLCWKAAFPGCSANMRIQARWLFSDGTAGPNMYDLDNPIAGGRTLPWNVQQLAPVIGRGLVVFEAGEDVVVVVHSEIQAREFSDANASSRMLGPNQRFAPTKYCSGD